MESDFDTLLKSFKEKTLKLNEYITRLNEAFRNGISRGDFANQSFHVKTVYIYELIRVLDDDRRATLSKLNAEFLVLINKQQELDEELFTEQVRQFLSIWDVWSTYNVKIVSEDDDTYIVITAELLGPKRDEQLCSDVSALSL